jgi:hypothetical protein
MLSGIIAAGIRQVVVGLDNNYFIKYVHFSLFVQM